MESDTRAESSPRISFSNGFCKNEEEGLKPLQSHSSPDFQFCLTQHHPNLDADQLFSNLLFLPTHHHGTPHLAAAAPPPSSFSGSFGCPPLPLSSGSLKSNKACLRDLLTGGDTEDADRRSYHPNSSRKLGSRAPHSQSFSGAGDGHRATIIQFPLLRRSNSTSSAANRGLRDRHRPLTSSDSMARSGFCSVEEKKKKGGVRHGSWLLMCIPPLHFSLGSLVGLGKSRKRCGQNNKQ